MRDSARRLLGVCLAGGAMRRPLDPLRGAL